MVVNRKCIKIGAKIVFSAIGTAFGGYAGKQFGLAIGGLLADGVIDFVADTTAEVFGEGLCGLMGAIGGSCIADELVEEIMPDEGNQSTDSSQSSQYT